MAWSKASTNIVKIKTFPSEEAFLFYYPEMKKLDILLLDIEMNGMNGVELAKKIRRENSLVQIIFITEFSHFVYEGYEVSALQSSCVVGMMNLRQMRTESIMRCGMSRHSTIGMMIEYMINKFIQKYTFQLALC